MSGKITFKYHRPHEWHDRHGWWTAYVDGKQLPCNVEGRERADTLGTVFTVTEHGSGTTVATRKTVSGVRAFIRSYYIRGEKGKATINRDTAKQRWFKAFIKELKKIEAKRVWRLRHDISKDGESVELFFIWRVEGTPTGWPDNIIYPYRYDFMGLCDPKARARKVVEIVEGQVERKLNPSEEADE